MKQQSLQLLHSPHPLAWKVAAQMSGHCKTEYLSQDDASHMSALLLRKIGELLQQEQDPVPLLAALRLYSDNPLELQSTTRMNRRIVEELERLGSVHESYECIAEIRHLVVKNDRDVLQRASALLLEDKDALRRGALVILNATVECSQPSFEFRTRESTCTDCFFTCSTSLATAFVLGTEDFYTRFATALRRDAPE